eukprot:331586-Chlamydomonas_euryale.AAC.5
MPYGPRPKCHQYEQAGPIPASVRRWAVLESLNHRPLSDLSAMLLALLAGQFHLARPAGAHAATRLQSPTGETGKREKPVGLLWACLLELPSYQAHHFCERAPATAMQDCSESHA